MPGLLSLITVSRFRRSPRDARRTQPESIRVSSELYTIKARIGGGFNPDCITISARRDNSLAVVADRWDLETSCRHEWLWSFGRDADMRSVKARYDAGILRVKIRRIPGLKPGIPFN
ncbi:hypothetical protein FRC08_015331 [Ceratobasidium sp. 394]|nr:hypothetical protein FRC08_015331 [Ceratobasidium sp. 394]KAG9101800.1 hypothetical protein FS749_003103 [Ceratobasidium sp. UAMH 11750]